MSLWVFLVACHGVHETGPAGVIGRVVDAAGAPVVDLTVETLEAKATTDAEGTFAVAWKDTRVLHFQKDGAWYERRSRLGDAGTVIELVLPERRSLAVTCPPTACNAELRWRLDEGFSARASVACDSAGERRLEGVPEGVPEVTCRAEAGAAPLTLRVTAEPGRLLLASPVPLTRVHVRGPECVVSVGDTVARPTDDGDYAVQIDAPAWVRAVCGGRPTLPIRVEPGATAEVPWSAEGPTLHLGPRGAVVDTLVLVATEWTLPLGRSDDGFPLPDLPAGTYRVLASGPEGPAPELLAVEPPEPSRSGVLAVRGEGAALVGRLRVDDNGLDERVQAE